MAYDRAKRRAHYEANREKAAARAKVYYETHREEINAYNRAYSRARYQAKRKAVNSIPNRSTQLKPDDSGNPRSRATTRPIKIRTTPDRGSAAGKRGETNYLAVLTEEIVLTARQLRRDGHSYGSIAEALNRRLGTLRFAIIGRTWSHVPDAVRIQGAGRIWKSGNCHSERESLRHAAEIKALALAGIPLHEIAARFKLSKTSIHFIASGKRYAHIAPAADHETLAKRFLNRPATDAAPIRLRPRRLTAAFKKRYGRKPTAKELSAIAGSSIDHPPGSGRSGRRRANRNTPHRPTPPPTSSAR